MDRAGVVREAQLDGKYRVPSSDPDLTAVEIAAGYRQQLQVERGWRDLKTTLDLHPVYHHTEDRIRTHTVLCWLALPLIPVAGISTHDIWRNLRDKLGRLHVGTFCGSAGRCLQRSHPTPWQAESRKELETPEPPPFYDFQPPAA